MINLSTPPTQTGTRDPPIDTPSTPLVTIRQQHHAVDINENGDDTENNPPSTVTEVSSDVCIPLLKNGEDERETDQLDIRNDVLSSQTSIQIPDADEDADPGTPLPKPASFPLLQTDRESDGVSSQTFHTKDFGVTAKEKDSDNTNRKQDNSNPLKNHQLPDTEHPSCESSKEGQEVCFLFGQGKQPDMTGRDTQLAAVSPVFRAMFADRWRRRSECGNGDSTHEVEIPDTVDANAFSQILRCSRGEDTELTEQNVEQALRVADMYQVLPVVDACFHFLLHRHPRRHRSKHLCAVLEMAHHLNYTHHYEECLSILKHSAARVLRNGPALSELCRECMHRLIASDDLTTVPEIVIHNAVVTWARRACANCGDPAPGWETLRATAGDLVYDVRYLAMPPRTLKNLTTNRSGHLTKTLLLTEAELRDLMNGDIGGRFPDTVRSRRQSDQPSFSCGRLQKKIDSACSVVFLIVMGILFLFAVLYVPILYFVDSL
ncbi:uncharacterized protein LOC143291007 [Babylonia areolata]|uniref:uncharacterized protein LOC143291007 n=1 Tax=Babylonia areolata TaxID=304850 RepID=UPI003FD02049